MRFLLQAESINRAFLLETQLTQEPDHGTPAGKAGLEQVEADKGGEQEPGGIDKVTQRDAEHDKKTGDDAEACIAGHHDDVPRWG